MKLHLCVVALLAAGSARADDYSLFNPVPDASLRPFCTDRPTKGTGVCTVDAGHLQIEADFFNATFDHDHGVSVDTYVYADPNIKLGLGDDTDIEIAFTPYEQVMTRRHGFDDTVSGLGDVFLRLKHNFVGNGGGGLGFALEPYVKLPTASNALGNGDVEGGIVAPLSFALSDVWSLSSAPELDIVEDADGRGYHRNGVLTLGIGRPLSDSVTVAAEVWADVDGDPSGTVKQYSFDVAATWQPPGTRDLQFDAGANLGLNSSTPDVQAYVGISKRW